MPPKPWLKMCAGDSIKRVNPGLKRWTRVIRVFPNIASLLRLVTARLGEIGDSPESEKVYLKMKHGISIPSRPTEFSH